MKPYIELTSNDREQLTKYANLISDAPCMVVKIDMLYNAICQFTETEHERLVKVLLKQDPNYHIMDDPRISNYGVLECESGLCWEWYKGLLGSLSIEKLKEMCVLCNNSWNHKKKITIEDV